MCKMVLFLVRGLVFDKRYFSSPYPGGLQIFIGVPDSDLRRKK